MQLYAALTMPDHTLQKPLLEIFSTFGYMAACKKKTRDPVIPSGGIPDQRILQSSKLRAFPVITQEQEFSQLRGL